MGKREGRVHLFLPNLHHSLLNDWPPWPGIAWPRVGGHFPPRQIRWEGGGGDGGAGGRWPLQPHILLVTDSLQPGRLDVKYLDRRGEEGVDERGLRRGLRR